MDNRKAKTTIGFMAKLAALICGLILLVGVQSSVYAEEDVPALKEVAAVEQDTGPGDTGPMLSPSAVSEPEICLDEKNKDAENSSVSDTDSEVQISQEEPAEKDEDQISETESGQLPQTDIGTRDDVAEDDVKEIPDSSAEENSEEVSDSADGDAADADVDAADGDAADADAVDADTADIDAADDIAADDTGADEVVESIVSDTATEITVNTDKDVVIDIEREGDKIVLSISTDHKKTVYANSEAVTKVTITSEKDVTLGENAKNGLLGKDFNIIKMPMASVFMRATNVLLISENTAPLTWFLKNLDIKAIPADKYSPTLIVQKEDYKAELVNQIINATGNVNIVSCNKKDPSSDEDALEEILDITIGDGDHMSEIAKQVIDDIKQDPAKLKDILGELTNDTSLFVIVKTQDTSVDLTNTSITAENIDITSYNRNTAIVNGLWGGITVAVINTDSKVLVKDSVLKANADHVNITAKSLVNSKGDVMFNLIPFSLALQIVLGDTKVDIIGTEIVSAGDINILVDRCATVKGKAAGSDTGNYKQSGIFLAIGAISGEYAVTIEDSAKHISKLDAKGNVSVRTEHFEEVVIEAIAQETHFDSLAGAFYPSDVNVSVQKIVDCLELVMDEYVYSRLYQFFDQKVIDPIMKNIISPIGDKIGDALGSLADANSTILLDDTFEQYQDDQHGAVKIKLKDEAVQQNRIIPAQTMITLSSEGEDEKVYTYTFSADGNECQIDGIIPGNYKVSVQLPQNYKQLYTKMIQVQEGKILNLRIFPTEIDYNRNQFAGTLAVDVVLVDANVTIDTKGEIRAGKDVLIRADSITRVNTVSDASAIDSIFTKIPTDATIVAAVVTPNMEQSVAGNFYLSDPGGNYYNSGITTTDEYKRVVIFDLLKGLDSRIPTRTLKEGIYHLYFTIPDNYDLLDLDKFKLAQQQPTYISDEQWNLQGVRWYWGEVKLVTATRPYTDLDGIPHYDPLGNPFVETYVKGITVLPRVKLKGSYQGDIPADKMVVGVAIGLSYINQNTSVTVDVGSITAQGITAEALNNQYKGSFKPIGLIRKNEKGEQVKDKDGNFVYLDTLSSKSDLTTKAGYSTGRTGLAGSIAVNIAKSNVSAVINSGKLYFTDSGSLVVNAHGGIFGNTSASGTGRKRDTAANAVGTGLAFSVFTEDVNAILGEQALFIRYLGGQDWGIDSIKVTAVNGGCQIVGAVSGGIGTNTVTPGLVVNVTVSETNALIKGSKGTPAIYLTGRGDVVVSAANKQQQSSNVSSSATGHDVAVGVSVAVAVSSYKQNALIERRIQNAKAVKVTAESTVPVTGSAIAGTTGAATKIPNKEGKVSGEPAPSPDEIAEAALKAAGEAVKKENKEKAGEIPKEAPQRAESSEGSVDVGASTVFVIYKNRNTAKITADVNCTDELSINAKHLVTITAKADSSAVISKTGVGVAVAIAYSDIENTAIMGADATAGSLLVQAVNPLTEISGDTNPVNAPNTVNVSSAAGVGASDVGVAGTLSLNVYKEKYRAEMGNAELNQVGASSCLLAEPRQKLTVYSGAANNEDAGAFDSDAQPAGYGAGVGMTFSYIDADAIVRDGSVIHTKGALTVQSETHNSMDVHAYAGDDPYTEVPVKGKVQLIFQDTDGKRIQGVKAGNLFLPASTSDVTGTINFEFAENAFYEIRVYEVPKEFQLPTSAIAFTVTGDGYKKTVTLLKTNQISKPKYKAVDAAVAINMLSSHVNATIGKDCSVTTAKDLSVLAAANTDSWAYTRGKASAEKTAAGMSAAANIAYEDINAILNGNATVGGNLKVDALSHSSDQATAYATASGLIMERLAEQMGVKMDELRDKYKVTKWINKPLPAYAPVTSVSKNFDLIIKLILKDSGLLTGKGYSIATKILYYGNMGISLINTLRKPSLEPNAGSAEKAKDAAEKEELGKVEVAEEGPDGITFAAAAGLNITKHNAKSELGGPVKVTGKGNVAVTAEGQNNYKAIGSGEAVSNQSAIAVGVAFVINNNEVSAKVLKSIADQENKAGTVEVKANALQNLSDGYNDDVTVQAIAGSAKGHESVGIGVAGAFAVFFNNMTTEAGLSDGVKIYANGKVSVDAIEKSKLSARAWGATLAAPLFDKKGGVVGGNEAIPLPDEKSSGVGASFAVIHANNKTLVTIGNYVTVEADEFEAQALKERVSTSDYRYDGVDLNGQVTIPMAPNIVVQINTTGFGGREWKPDNALPLTFDELLEEGISLVNVLASRNYYVEAVGGAISSDSKLTGAGSFSYVFMNDVADVIIGDHFTLVTANGADIKADSDVNFALIGGSLAYGGKVGAGATVTAVINKEEVKALIGSDFTYTGADLSVNAGAKADVLEVLVAAAASYPKTVEDNEIIQTATAVDGVINIYVGDTDVKASVGPRAIISAGKVRVHAENTCVETGITGGASLGAGRGVGTSVNVLSLNSKAIAEICEGLSLVKSAGVDVTAYQKNELLNIVANGALPLSADSKSLVAVNPAVYVDKTVTKALLGTAKEGEKNEIHIGSVIHSAGKVNVAAEDHTELIDVNGAVGISTGATAVGGAASVQVVLKDVKAMIADGTAMHAVKIYADGGVNVSVTATENLKSFVIGLGGGKDSSASGSLNIVVVSNDLEAAIGDYAQIDRKIAGADVSVSASDDIYALSGAGSITVSAAGSAYGLSNVDVILDGSTVARIGKQVLLNAHSVMVAGAGKTNIQGSIVVLSIGSTVQDENAENIDGNKNLSTNIAAEMKRRTDNAISMNPGFAVQNSRNNKYITDVNETLKRVQEENSELGVILFTKKNVKDSTIAYIGDGGTTTSTKGDIKVEAIDQLTLYATAGSAGGSGGLSVGVSAVVAVLKNRAEASIGGIVTGEGDVIVNAYNIFEAKELAAIGGGGSMTITGNGTIQLLVIDTAARAAINANAEVDAGGNVVVYADSDVMARIINGNACGSAGGAAGAVISLVKVNGETIAEILAKSVTSDADTEAVQFINGNISGKTDGDAFKKALDVENKDKVADADEQQKLNCVSAKADTEAQYGILVGAHSSDTFYNWLAAAGGAGTASVMGSVNAFDFERTTKSFVRDSILEVNQEGDVVVSAIGHSAMQDIVGSISAAGVFAAGIANDSVLYANTVIAEVSGADITSDGNILIQAKQDHKLLSIAAGAGGGNISVNDSNAVIAEIQKTKALVKDCTLEAKGSIRIVAESDQDGTIIAGSANGGLGAVGAGVVVLDDENETIADVSGGSVIIAKGKLASGKENGFIMHANADTDMNVITFGASGGKIAVDAATTVFTDTSTVKASTSSDTKINQVSPKQIDDTADVILTAKSDKEIKAGAGSVVAGLGAVSAAITIYNADNTVTAHAGGIIYAGNRLIVQALENDKAEMDVIGAGAAVIGSSNSGSSFKFTSHVTAAADGKLDVNSFAVHADNCQIVTANALVAGVAGGAIEAAVNVVDFNSTTKSYVNSTQTIFAEDSEITATSKEVIHAKAAMGVFSGAAGIASVLVANIHVTTEAYTADYTVIEGGNNGSLTIKARDDAELRFDVATVGVSALGNGNAAVAVLSVDNTVLAMVGKKNTITVKAFELISEAFRDITGNTAAGGAAAYGTLSGAVVVINIGNVISGMDKAEVVKGIDTLAENNSDKATANAYLTNNGQNGADIRNLANDATAKIQFNIKGMFIKTEPAHATVSLVGEESIIRISGKSRVEAKDETVLNVFSGSVSGAIGGSVGGSYLKTIIKGDVLAVIRGTIEKNSKAKRPVADLSVTASQSLTTVNHKALQGNGGVVGSFGAAFVTMDITENVKAELEKGGKLVSLGRVEFNALQNMKAEQDVTNVSAAIIAAGGITTSEIKQTSEVASLVAGENSEENLKVYAYSTLDDYIHVLASGGGLVTGITSTELTVEEKSVITAQVAGKTTASDSVEIVAQKLLSIDADCEGVEVSIGVASGSSDTKINVQPSVYAKADGAINAGGAVRVLALYNKYTDGSDYRGNKNEDQEYKGNIHSVGSACGGAVIGDFTGIDTKIDHADEDAEHIIVTVDGTISAGDVLIKADSYIEIQATNKTYSFGGILAKGKVGIRVMDQLHNKIDITGMITAKKNVKVDAGHSSNYDIFVKGLGGGVIIADDKLILTLVSETGNVVYVSADITAEEDLQIHTDKKNHTREQIDGYSVSGITALGNSELSTVLDSDNMINISQGKKLTSGKMLSIKADTNIDRDSRSYASTCTGVDADSDSLNTTNSMITTHVIANGAFLHAGDGLELMAGSCEKLLGHAKEYLAGFLCFGDATLQECIDDSVLLSLVGTDIEVLMGELNLQAASVIDNSKFEIHGGHGSAGSNVDEKADVTINQNAEIILDEASVINRNTGDTIIRTIIGSDVDVRGDGDYKSFVEASDSDAYSRVTADGRIRLNNVNIDSKGDVNIAADYTKLRNSISYSVESNPGGALTLSADEDMEVLIAEHATFTVEGYGNIFSAGNLHISAGHEAREGEVYTDVYGYLHENSAAFGSVTVIAENDTQIESHVHMNSPKMQSVLKGQNITLAAYLPGQKHHYEKRAVAKAWSDAMKEEEFKKGSYTEKTCQELDVKAYTGEFADLTIVFDEHGASLSKDVNYDLHEDKNTLEVYFVEPKTPGKLTLIAEGGSITGKVDLPEKDAVEEMTIINHSPYDMVLDTVEWEYDKISDEAMKGRISIDAADAHDLSVTYGKEHVNPGSSLSVISDHGGDVIFAGEILLPKGEVNVEFVGESGDLLFGENKDMGIRGELAVHALSVTNAKNVGTPERPVYVLSIQYKDGDTYAEPTVHIDAQEDVFFSTSYVRYFEVSSQNEIDKIINNNRTIVTSDYVEPISAGGDLVLNILPTYLLFADLSKEYETPLVAHPFQTKGEKAEDGKDYTFKAPLKDGMYGFTTKREEYVLKSTSVTKNADLYIEMTDSGYRFGSDEDMDRYPNYDQSQKELFLHAGENAVVNGYLAAGDVRMGDIMADHGKAVFDLKFERDNNQGQVFIGSVTGKDGVTVNADTLAVLIGYLESSEDIALNLGGNLTIIGLKAPSVDIHAKGDVINPLNSHQNEYSQFIADTIRIVAGGFVGLGSNCMESMPYDKDSNSPKVLEIHAGKGVVWHSLISDIDKVIIDVPGKAVIRTLLSDGSVLYQNVSEDKPNSDPTQESDPEEDPGQKSDPEQDPQPGTELGTNHTGPATGDTSDLLFWLTLFMGATLLMIAGCKKYRTLH